jgi:uncharacterized protein
MNNIPAHLTPATAALAFGAAIVAGAINAVAGGGTLLTYTTLFYVVGLPGKIANATNTMALLPASFAGTLGFRNTVPKPRSLVVWFCVSSILGGITGAYFLMITNEKLFEQIVPWLIICAAVMVILQERIVKALGLDKGEDDVSPPPRGIFRRAAPFLFQFVVGIYGGYFGAGIGIIMLAALALMRIGDIYHMSFLKNIGAFCINGSAILVLGIGGLVNWKIAGMMAVGSLVGGYVGANLAKRAGPKKLRLAISIVGFLIAGNMLYNMYAK